MFPNGRNPNNFIFEQKIEAFSIGNDTDKPELLRAKYFEKIDNDFSKKDASSFLWKSPFHFHKNRWWPETMKQEEYRHFKEIMLSSYEMFSQCSLMILECLALSMDLPQQRFIQMHDKKDHIMELKHYPSRTMPVPSSQSQDTMHSPQEMKKSLIDQWKAFQSSSAFRNRKTSYKSNISSRELLDDDGSAIRLKSHADLSSISLLLQSADLVHGGLQILTNEGVWIHAPYIENTVLVNTGACMERWTNGRLKSTKHRVIWTEENSLRSRYSMVYFCFPNWETEMVVLPELADPVEISSNDGHSDPHPIELFGDWVPFA